MRCLDQFSWAGASSLEAAEAELAYLVEARGAFADLDGVTLYLVHRVTGLAARLKGLKASRSRAYALRACIAYAHITIPSIMDPAVRARLYAHTAR